MDSCYKLRQLFYYKVRHGLLQIATGITSAMGLLQIATGITKCDEYYKLRLYTRDGRGSACPEALENRFPPQPDYLAAVA